MTPFKRSRRTRRRKDRLSTRQAGLLGIVLLILIAYLAVTKFADPFASQYTTTAVFPSANGLVAGDLVRVAGVNVGTVKSVSVPSGCDTSDPQACQAADVTMALKSTALPLHENATFDIRPRIFLEGNFFVEISPGTPSSPIAPSGYTFPIGQGQDPVQFDQVLDTLPAGTRANLQTLLEQYGSGIDDSARAYDASIPYWTTAYRATGQVSHDFLGEHPHDLSGYIHTGGQSAAAFDAHPQQLQDMITGFDQTAGAFARQNAALRTAVGELPQTLQVATPAFDAVNRALPPLERLAHALLPGVQTANPTITASLPFLAQVRALVAPNELQGLSDDLSRTIPSVAQLAKRTIPLMTQGVRPVSSCITSVIYPWSQLTLDDHTLDNTTGFPLRKVYVEAVDYLPGLAGESRDFDANGPYIRVLGNGGTFTYSLQPGLFGQALSPITATQPQLPPGGKRPPLESTVPCESQAPITSLDATPGGAISQVQSNLKAPGAAERWHSVAQAALAQITQVAKQQNVPVKLSSTVKAFLGR